MFASCLLCSGVIILHWVQDWVDPRPDGRSSKEISILSLPGKLMLERRLLIFRLQRQQCISQTSRWVSLSQGYCTSEIICSWNTSRFAWRRNIVIWQASGYSRFFKINRDTASFNMSRQPRADSFQPLTLHNQRSRRRRLTLCKADALGGRGVRLQNDTDSYRPDCVGVM
jgi:hypothetical protein